VSTAFSGLISIVGAFRQLCVCFARMNKKKEQEESGTCVECGGVYRHASDPKKQEEWNVVLDFWQLDA